MAELPDRKQQNQAFLQELERQRLNKDCLRIIDLRGKVAGECQAYEFGGRVHHLDDRAYLLVKQLMSRFDGRYTIGVYEALFKALKQLAPAEDAVVNVEPRPKILSLDKSIQRAETRIVYTTPIALRLDDVLYHGHTIDMAVNAIRVSLRRSYTLQLEDEVAVTFIDFAEQNEGSLMSQLPYRVIKLDHDASYTTAVLSRIRDGEDAFAEWMQQWLEAQAGHRQQDIDNDILNLQAGFYQRLWLAELSCPLLWLAEGNSPEPLSAFHLMPSARSQLAGWQTLQADWLQKLPLMALAKGAGTILAAFDNAVSFSAPLAQTDSVKKLINWHLAQPLSRLLLLNATEVSIDKTAAQYAAEVIAEEDPEESRQCLYRAGRTQRRVMVTDLQPAMQHLQPTETVTAAQLNPLQTLKPIIDSLNLTPDTLDSYIQRDKPRFYIHTPVTVSVGAQQWSVTTLDASADGLAVSLPADCGIKLHQRLLIDFTRWQTLTDKVKLSAVPYEVRNSLYWQGTLRLGLQRIKSNCPESLNQFFNWVIKKNQQKLNANQDHKIKTAQNRLYSQALLPTLESIPLFIGTDTDGQRQIQLVGETRRNQAASLRGLWQALNAEPLRLTEQLKQLNTSECGLIQSTLYAYADNHDSWMLAFETDFQTSRDKAVFIQRGLAATRFKVFISQLTPVKSQDTEQQADLMAKLLQWRPQRAHKVAAIRQQLSHLQGLLQLTDITASISAFYRA
ncbi:PilZ domain-containing protein [Methylophaga sp. OBS1]|uniref:PilZ domain-containing protein n=1 Tax=Methylophaga sp. OBS1 TaxID=2991933 RepID=UPI002251093B|nr:PilZ domain-containing protein [Methylophaga sp. OBS1]MCX4193796.1 PilZ domain-containing protein [Methylophaga sp. OBS1]